MTSPRVCIDGFNLGLAKGSGIATYARNLTYAVKDMGWEAQLLYAAPAAGGRENLLNEIALIDAARTSTWLLEWTRRMRAMGPPVGRTATRVDPSGEVITRQYSSRYPPADVIWAGNDIFQGSLNTYVAWKAFTPVRLGKLGVTPPEIMHWTSPLPMFVRGAANLHTIHDVIPLRLPFATLDHKKRFLKLCRRLGRRSDQLVTVSEHSRQDMVRLLKIPESRISVTHQSVEIPAYLTDKPDEEVAAEIEGVFDLGWRSYFLYFGAIEPKKNLARIIEAYLETGSKAPLVVVGAKGWLDEDETRMAAGPNVETLTFDGRNLRRTDRIRRLDYLPFPLLVSLIRGARATLFPSLYEGFGLPVLESMLLGTPVLTSTAGSLPEVAGEAALFVDPYDTRAIKKAILALDADEGLREDLAARGRVQADKFSAANYRQRLAELYKPFV